MSTDNLPLNVAISSYGIAKTAHESYGAKGLPEWPLLTQLKKDHLTNAAAAALRGQPVWEVWAISCGEEPNDATQVLWRDKAPALQLLPKVFAAFGSSVGEYVELPSTEEEEPPTADDILEDAAEEPEVPDTIKPEVVTTSLGTE